MKNKMLSKKNGLDYYTFVIALVGILILAFIVATLFTKQYSLSKGVLIGTEQFRILKAYSEGGKALLFVDTAARAALEQSAYSSGKSGFYQKPPSCENEGQFTYWARDFILGENQCNKQSPPCFPDDTKIKGAITGYFSGPFNESISNFNKSVTTLNATYNHYLTVSGIAKTESSPAATQIMGATKAPVKVSLPNIAYYVMPNFKASLPIDILGNGLKIVGIAGELKASLLAADKGGFASTIDSAKGFDWNYTYSSRREQCTWVGPCCEMCGDPPACCKNIIRTVIYDESTAFTYANETKAVPKLLITELVKNQARTEYKNLGYYFGLKQDRIVFDETCCGGCEIPDDLTPPPEESESR